jgi:two-component system chemotaxis sensor kinase CheA
MNPLLVQFLSEAREFSEAIGNKLMQLEGSPNDQDAINELFRLVHTLKGNSGLFTFPEMTRVLHAGEDLLGMVRNEQVVYSRELADCLLDAMDFVMVLCDEVETTGAISSRHAQGTERVTKALRALMPVFPDATENDSRDNADRGTVVPEGSGILISFEGVPAAARLEALRHIQAGDALHWVIYTPAKECFFQGDDPFHIARQVPGLLWGTVRSALPLPPLAELDTYSCALEFHLLTAAPREELEELFRYVIEQVKIVKVDPEGDSVPKDSAAPPVQVEIAAVPSIVSDEVTTAIETILSAQKQILGLDDQPVWKEGRTRAVAAVLKNLSRGLGEETVVGDIEEALSVSLAAGNGAPLLHWMENRRENLTRRPRRSDSATGRSEPPSRGAATSSVPARGAADPVTEEPTKFGRRAEDNLSSARSLKVDQAKIDMLMNLIGELVVEKNALPYLAQRAETQYGVRELSREIKAQYSVINRIADEMQYAIMQVRMMAVSVVFQRFPRLVRDISHKLNKEVQLALEGEQTEADKNIIESLADPLIHIVRNSLDHGLETPEVRRASGKPETGTLTIRAAQEADRVVIEIIDDGKGIDPKVIKRKAYEKGLIDEAALERMGDQEAINLIFAAGLSTAETISDLSGRGVGMDVVRSAVEKMHGTVVVNSELGKGTKIRISLPLSMAVSQVMIVESDRQLFGVPMDHVVETVRVSRSAVRFIKQSMTVILRGRVVPLKTMNGLLGIAARAKTNADDEFAVLLVQVGGGVMGLVVDGFRETIGVIQKPLVGILSGLPAYSGSALMGDGSVLMILNIRELL